MSVIALDFETYFSREYSLRKLTTEAYVRDSRFECLCLGLKPNQKTPAKAGRIKSHQLKILSRVGVIAHHAHFDGLILNEHFGVKPAFWFDTLSMARLVYPHDKSHSLESLADKFNLTPKSVPYDLFINKHWEGLDINTQNLLLQGCAHDVDLTYNIFKRLLPLVPKEELKLIDLTVRLFTEPVLELDQERVKKYADELLERQEKLLISLGVNKKDLSSNDKFAKILEGFGVEPPTKISPRTGKTTYAFAKTDQAFVDMLDGEDESLSLLCQARLSAKSTIGETRAFRLIHMSQRGNLPVYLKYYGAHTGRWSGGDKLNFQNFPKEGELRKSILAPEGYVLVVLDLSQIECRMLCYLAGEQWALDAFAQGKDLYCDMASSVYGRIITKQDKTERFLGKTLVLGAGFGVGWKKLQNVLKLNKIYLTDDEAKRAIQSYRHKNPNIVQFWRHADWVIERMYKNDETPYNWGPVIVKGRSIYLPNGACLDYSSLGRDSEGYYLDTPRGKTKLYGGKLTENVVQALARIVLSQAMLKISKLYRICLTTHDELVYLAPLDEADMAYEIGLNILKSSPDWCRNIPLEAEGGYDVRYSK
ncbi:MAG: hypothetical protein KGL39_11820 [Patescibacteria group bacterium]|nr:hypothetical protein [Patescibacteria group bacterium]